MRLDKLHYYHNIFNVYGLPNRPHAPGEPGFVDADDYAEKSKHLNLKYYQLEYQDPWAKRKPYCRQFTSPLFTLE